MNLCFFGKHELTNGMIYNRKIPSDIFHMKNMIHLMIWPFKCQSHKIVKHTQTTCLSVFGHFVILVLKRLRYVSHERFPQFDLEKFPGPSNTIMQHIFWGYLQWYMWLRAPLRHFDSSTSIWLQIKRRWLSTSNPNWYINSARFVITV